MQMHKIIFNDNKFVEWSCKLLFSLDLIMVGINYEDHYYPLNVLIIIMIAFWFYSFKLKLFSLIILLVAFIINYTRIGVGPSYELIMF